MVKHAHSYPSHIQIKRAYVDPEPGDGYRVLIDRLWPRGRKKETLALDAWLPDLAPSTELRKAFHAAPDDWESFHKQYDVELKDADQQSRMAELLHEAAGKTLTLVYGAANPTHNHAVILLAALEHAALKFR